ncbi:MAG: ABC transporter ATP-binding protein [Chloroflexi bacterium]|nr:ABC transporter ATP-binding protein [Chloroflexota bacterium]
MRALWRSLRYLKTYWQQTAIIIIALLISSGTMLALPRLAQMIIDDGIAGRNPRLVIGLSLTMMLLGLVRALFQFAQGALSARIAHGIAYDLRNDLYAKIQSLSFSYHDRSHTGQLLTRATSDVELVQGFVGRGATTFLSSLVMITGALIFLFATDPRLALIMLVLMPLTLALFGAFARPAMPLFKAIQEKLSALNTVLQENFGGVRVIKALGREDHEEKRFDIINVEYMELALRVNRLISLAFPTMFGLLSLATLAVYWIGGRQVILGGLTLGELVAFANYITMAFFPVIALGGMIAFVATAGASATRIFEILDAAVDITEKPTAIDLPRAKGHIEFDQVGFRYIAEGDPVLCEVSFTVEPGQTLALLGATGSGKSTIINLIPRFYDVTEGAVLIDGYDVRDLTLDSLRSQIGIVLQETTLFEGTIRENLAFGRADASQEAIEQAARAAEAHEFIMSFTDGYDTHVGERGVTLSGGQKQRIAIARALLRDPRILILDDATSSVDLSTEFRIQQALERLMAGRTSIVIAQRVATVLNADQILVLDNGRVAARGTHEALLENSELYAEIYSSQLVDDRVANDAAAPQGVA